MTSFFDDLEAQLHAAAQARTQQRPRRGRRWLGAGARATPVVVALATTAAVAVAALLLFSHHKAPSPSPSSSPPPAGALTPSPHLRREMSYIALAGRQVAGLKMCQLRAPTGPRLIPGAPSQKLLSILGVLRRPATRADHLSARFLSDVNGVYSGYVRQAAVLHGTSYYIAAARDDLAAQGPASGCLALESAALHRLLPSIPAALRAPTLKLESEIAAYSRKILANGPQDTICVGTHSRNSGGEECGLTAAAISAGVGPTNDSGTFSSVVPDGVASVTLRIRRRDGRTVSVTAPVWGNIYAVHVADAGNNAPMAITWRSPQGNAIKTVTQPSAAALARYCRRHIACAALAMGGVAASSSSSSGGGGGGFSEASSSSSSTSAAPASGSGAG